MADWTATHIPAAAPPRAADRSVTLPQPQPFGAPVLISDCVTPLAGETVLSLLMKRMMRAEPEDGEPN